MNYCTVYPNVKKLSTSHKSEKFSKIIRKLKWNSKVEFTSNTLHVHVKRSERTKGQTMPRNISSCLSGFVSNKKELRKFEWNSDSERKRSFIKDNWYWLQLLRASPRTEQQLQTTVHLHCRNLQFIVQNILLKRRY